VIEASALNSDQFFYGPRVVLVGRFPYGDRAPGEYQLEIRVLDRISNNRLTTTTNFIVKEAPAPLIAEADEED